MYMTKDHRILQETDIPPIWLLLLLITLCLSVFIFNRGLYCFAHGVCNDLMNGITHKLVLMLLKPC